MFDDNGKRSVLQAGRGSLVSEPYYVARIERQLEYIKAQIDNIQENKGIRLDVNGDVWGAIVSFVTAHQDDIENGENDFGELLPVCEYFNRNT